MSNHHLWKYAIAISIGCLVSYDTIALSDDAAPRRFAEIRVVDAATGRGVPLVELETVNALRYVTDNAGRVAFQEPGLLGQTIFFNVRSHGYISEKDRFGIEGVMVTPRVGEVAEIRIRRKNLAERMCRLTGEGTYRDSILLGSELPPFVGAQNGAVAGQDSVQAIEYHGKIMWLWGDTLRMRYPLGLFRTAGAITPMLTKRESFESGIAFDYFVDQSGFARAMMPMKDHPEGVVWIDGAFVVPDEAGNERLVAHYSRRKGLVEQLEHGIAVYNDQERIFESAVEFPLDETWRHPKGHPFLFEEEGKKWILMGSSMPNIRVPATLRDVCDVRRYEGLTCAKSPGGKQTDPDLESDGSLKWRWSTELPPVDSEVESSWLRRSLVKAESLRFSPVDVDDPNHQVRMHTGTVHWNAHRNKWVMIGVESGTKPSILGEVWYAESASPTGPFRRAVRIVTHDRQTFYNVCHHAFLDQDGGRSVYFEGTYTNDFSGNPDKTPRYNYNQVLYRLDVDTAAQRLSK